MSDLTRIASAAKTIITSIGYTIQAVDDVRKGKYEEGLSRIALATGKTILSWDDIKYSWNVLNGNADSVNHQDALKISVNHPSALKSSHSPSPQHGYFTGSWFSKKFNKVEMIYHHRSTNAIFLYVKRMDKGGYNTYSGGIDLEREVIVWAGYNSIGENFAIVGTPDYEGHNIHCDAWKRENSTNQLKYAGYYDTISRM